MVLSDTLSHGKTSLTAAITTVLSKKNGSQAMAYDQIDGAPEDANAESQSQRTAHVEYETIHATTLTLTAPGHADYVKT